MSPLSLRVILPRILCLLPVFAVFSATAQRQKTDDTGPRLGSTIVNDSTQNVYGPKTTLWTTEHDLFTNRPNYRPLDTAVNNYHRWTYVQRFNYYYKDLGVMGTALSPIFPQAPSSIGAWSGFDTYEPYYNSEEPHYFNTRSPYTRMYVIWGGQGRATTRVEFSRNINPRWNIGFNYRPILVEKMIQREPKTNRATVSHYYDFYTTYKSKNDRYFILFNFRRMRHRVIENGGVKFVEGVDPPSKYFESDNAQPNLTGAHSEAYIRNIHLFHSYQLAKPFQIYHIADITKKTNSFEDDVLKDPNSLFDNTEKVGSDTTKVRDMTTFISQQQEIGIKGNAAKLFYSAHLKFRTYEYSNPYLDSIPPAPVQLSGAETYVGGTLSLKPDSLSELAASAEYLFGGFYRIEGTIQSPWLDGYFKNSLSKPGFMQMYYHGSHDSWSQAYNGISATQAHGLLKFIKGPVDFRAGGTFTLLHNYVYFKQVAPTAANKQTVLPFQSSGNQSTFAPEVRLSVRFFDHFYFKPQVIYNSFIVNDDKALRIPDVFINAQLTYENNLFKGHLQVQTGVDVHWQSTYQALGYDLTTQQFYVQDKDFSQAFPVTDVFFTGKMRRARFFFKYHNLVQAITKSGYLPTPGYPGQYNVIDFGFDFLLFD
jgi:hypothetical protein